MFRALKISAVTSKIPKTPEKFQKLPSTASAKRFIIGFWSLSLGTRPKNLFKNLSAADSPPLSPLPRAHDRDDVDR